MQKVDHAFIIGKTCDVNELELRNGTSGLEQESLPLITDRLGASPLGIAAVSQAVAVEHMSFFDIFLPPNAVNWRCGKRRNNPLALSLRRFGT